MEDFLRLESAESRATNRVALVGLGNPLHGDDAVGLIVARSVFGILRHEFDVELLDCPVPNSRLGEILIGFLRAVIIDAFVDSRAKVGTVKRVKISGRSRRPSLSLHTTGFRNLLALAQMVGLSVPKQIHIYGISILQPRSYSEGLSPELHARLPGIVMDIATEELRCARRSNHSKGRRIPRPGRTERSTELVKGPP